MPSSRRIPFAPAIAAWTVRAACVAVLLAGSGAARAESPFETDVRPLIQKFCHDCHNNKKAKSDVNLEPFDAAAKLTTNPQLWQDVVWAVRERDMPPDDHAQPTDEERDKLIAAIEHTLASLEWEADPGRTVIRRLTRVEYNRTVWDLLGVDSAPADAFPADGGGEGFDNHAATLYLPPVLMERYIQAARLVAEQARPQMLFTTKPGDGVEPREAARRILDDLLPRAFRRPARAGEVDRYLGLFDATVKRGVEFEPAVRRVVSAILVSPHFLYRIETDRPDADGPYAVNDFELATRLSYLLWSSMPDRELFDLAAQGRLHEPDVLAAQVDRMLNHERSWAFAEQFVSQWLDIRLIHSHEPDGRRYPKYDGELASAMYNEAVSFFHHVTVANAPLTDLIAADYTFVNAKLAEHYGIGGVEGEQMRRVEVKDGRRGGVATMGAVLTTSSYPERTSPVLRGKWVLETILGQEAPPAPANVETLPPDDRPRDGLTFRQRLEKHRANPSCASCHDKIDPLGFGLENFDAVGAWRDDIGGAPVDASGKMPTGEEFAGPAQLKQILLKRRDAVVRHVTEKLLAYALARGLEAHDTPVVDKIIEQVKADDYRARAWVKAVVTSYPFTHRRNAAAALDAQEANR